MTTGIADGGGTAGLVSDDEEYQHRENHEPAISENDLPPQITAS